MVLEGAVAGIQPGAKEAKQEEAIDRNRVIVWMGKSEKCHLWRNQQKYWIEGEEGNF